MANTFSGLAKPHGLSQNYEASHGFKTRSIPQVKHQTTWSKNLVISNRALTVEVRTVVSNYRVSNSV